jgi:hypothetical protein
MAKQFEVEALVSASSQSTSKNGHETSITFLTTEGERIVLKLSGHTVAKLKRHLGHALLPPAVEREDAA